MKKLLKKLESHNDNSQESGSSSVKITGTLALIALLTGIGIASADGQTLVNKKEYDKILQIAEKSQEEIGEDMAKFLFGWEMQRWLQLELEKQNKKHPWKYIQEEFNIFKEEYVESESENDSILSTKQMEDILMRQVDSILTKDVARFYNGFHEYQKNGTNLVWKEKWKWDYMNSWWNYAEYPVNMNIDALKNYKKLPYKKEELDNLRKEYENIFEKEFSKRKAKSEKARISGEKVDYEGASLRAMEEAKLYIKEQIRKMYIVPFIKEYNKQFHSREKDAK